MLIKNLWKSWIFKNFRTRKLKFRCSRWNFTKISSVQNFLMVPKSMFPASKAVALAGKPAANCNIGPTIFRIFRILMDFIKINGFHWFPATLIWPPKHCIRFILCRRLPGQYHRFKRRKRVFWHHKKVLYRGNLTQFHLEERNLIFSSENSWKSRKSSILVKFH